jgi:basic membrane lipoprotein Med (substrate-binding protein (PBP1-ABC) superfamily)
LLQKKYDFIITSNPFMPEICRDIKTTFKKQNFLILEGSRIDNDTVSTFLFSHMELSYKLGYLAEWGANRAQGFLGIPPILILSFPYFLTSATLWIFSIRKSQAVPPPDTKLYFC